MSQVRQPLGPRMLHPRELSGWGGLGLGVLTVELPAGPGLHPPNPGNLDRTFTDPSPGAPSELQAPSLPEGVVLERGGPFWAGSSLPCSDLWAPPQATVTG